MPSSRPCTIPYVLHLVSHLHPRSILDVGIGFGKWGYLFREYTDIVGSEHEPERYAKEGWRTNIEGIEAFEPYLHAAHHYVYDKIHIGDAATILPTLGQYDVVFFGDIIEHFEIEQGKALLSSACEHAEKCVCLTTPRFDTGQGGLCNNPLEEHRSLWAPSDFRDVGDCRVYLADRRTYFVVYWRSQDHRIDPEWTLDVQAGLPRNLRRLARSLMRVILGR